MWTTGASVRRFDYWDGVEYDEVLQVDSGSVRLDRLNAGAPFLDTHCSYGLDNVIGSVMPGTASVGEGRGIATILLSKAPGVADTVQKIREGVIRNISVGYWIHKVVKTEGDDGTVARWDVVDWEPLEISAVPIPADPGSQVRAESYRDDGKGPALRSCTIEVRNPPKPRGQGSSPARTETTMATRTAPKKPSSKRATPAEAEAEKKRLAALRAAKRDDEKKDDEDGDESDDERDDDADEENAADDSDSEKDDGGDDERGADDEGDDDEDESGKKDDERSVPAVTAKRAAEAAVKAERQRTAKITEMAERAGMAKFGKRHIADGTSTKRFGELVLERMLAQQEKRGKETFAASSDQDVSRERGAKAPNASQREMADGESHWARVAGKPAKTA